ncbi:hypothetical protein LCGC14_2687530, partial [marine sediment metagenome]
AATIGGAALTGAAIGSFIPVVGTVVGAAVGGLIGVVKEWKDITKNIPAVFGKLPQDFSKEFKDLVEDAQGKSKAEKEDIDKVEERIIKANKANIESIKSGNITGVFKDIWSEQKAKQKKIKTEEEVVKRDVDVEYKTVGGETKKDNVKGTIKEIRDLVSDKTKERALAKQILEINRATWSQEEGRVEAAEKEVNELSNQIKLNEAVLVKITEIDGVYRNLVNDTKVLSDQQHYINVLIEKQKEWVAGIGELYSAQLGTLDAIIKRMSMTGQIDIGVAEGKMEQALKTLYAQKDAAEDFIEYIKANADVVAEAKLDPDGMTEQLKGFFFQLKDQGVSIETFGELADAEQIETLKKLIEEFPSKAMEIRSSMKGLFNEPIRGAELLSAQTGLMVQLADNFAIGVGAAASLRVKQYEDQAKVITQLEDMLALQLKNIRAYEL